MHLTHKLGTVAALAGASLAMAAPSALAKSTKYVGTTRDGDPISFTVKGSTISKVRSYVPTVCLATEGIPMSGTSAFDPSGTFRLGHTGKTSATRENEMWNTADVTKNFEITTKRGRNGVISGKLHSDFSYLMILFTYPISSRPYVCTGDTTFTIAPKA
jgi:hypothetical protein